MAPTSEVEATLSRRGSDGAAQLGMQALSPRHDVRSRPHHHFEASYSGLIESFSSHSLADGMKHSFELAPGGGAARAPAAFSLASAALPALNLALLALLLYLLHLCGAKQQDLFFLYYQPFAPPLGMLWLWGVNVRYFERHNVRYEACFAAEDQRFLLPAAAIFKLANVLTSLAMGSGTLFVFYCASGDLESAALQPPLVYLAMLGVLLFPGRALFRDSRRFFAATAWRVATPIRGVTWADFLLADVLTSLAKALSDAERAVCTLASGPAMDPAPGACGDASWLIPAGLAAPYAWRLVQCLRVHADTGARPQLWNALKYATAFPVIALSFAKYHVPLPEWRALWKPLWLAAAVANSAFSFYWDVERDWEVGFFSQMGRQPGALVPTPVLAPALLYPRPFYLYLMASNALLRLSWIYKLSPHLRRNHFAVFSLVLAEAFRRFQWMFVRVEVELRKLQAARPELGQLVPAPAGGAGGGAGGGAPSPSSSGATPLKRDASDASLADAKL